jgi:transcriptional regulator of arginine metabolism
MKKYTKKKRQQLLKEIITERDIGDQLQIGIALKKRGIKATQATISRDLQEMGIVKTRISPGVYRYEIIDKVPEGVLWAKLQIFFDNFVNDIKSTHNQILIKTTPGNANGVASLIDHIELNEILGTIAGDDTVLVILDSIKNRKLVEKKFIQIFEKR